MNILVRVLRLQLCLAVAVACGPTPPPAAESPSGPENSETEPEPILTHGDLPPELQALKDQGLEVRGDRVKFVGDLEFPPKVAGFPTDTTIEIEVIPGPHPSVADARQSMRTAALADSRVAAKLGDRYALLGSGWLEPDKDDKAASSADRYQMEFYNYSSNQTVTVVSSSSGKIIDLRSEYAVVQPTESHEEVDAAVQIVRAHSQYGDMIKDLDGRGIVTEGEGKDRYIYLLFYRKPRTAAVVDATVNMSTGSVVAARQLNEN